MGSKFELKPAFKLGALTQRDGYESGMARDDLTNPRPDEFFHYLSIRIPDLGLRRRGRVLVSLCPIWDPLGLKRQQKRLLNRPRDTLVLRDGRNESTEVVLIFITAANQGLQSEF